MRERYNQKSSNMAKEITGYVKLQVKGGQANPAPPIGPALGSKGINIMEFCKQFNARTQDRMGKVLPVLITVFSDKSFIFIIKTPPAAVQAKPKPAEAPATAKREAPRRPGESFKDCDNCPELVVLPAGAFVMGSPDGEQGRSADEGPQHVVTVAHPGRSLVESKAGRHELNFCVRCNQRVEARIQPRDAERFRRRRRAVPAHLCWGRGTR